MEILFKELQFLVKKYCRNIEQESKPYLSICAKLTLGKDIAYDSWLLNIDTLPLHIEDNEQQYRLTIKLDDIQTKEIAEFIKNMK